MRIRSLPTLIVTCYTFLATTNHLWTRHDEYNMSLWWCYVPYILLVDVHQKVRSNFLAQQLQSCLIFSTRNKIGYELFVSISPQLGSKIWTVWKSHWFTVQISYLKTKMYNRKINTSTTFCCLYWYISIYSEKCFWLQYMYSKLSRFNG